MINCCPFGRRPSAERMVAYRPMRLFTILCRVSMIASPITMDDSMSAPTSRDPSPMDVYGPTYVSGPITQSRPITAGPRMTLPDFTTLRAPIRTRPSTRAPGSTVPSIPRSMSSRSRWFASRISSGFPVSFRHPEFLRARDVAQHDLRVVALFLELADHRADAALEDVVPEVHAEGLVPDERLGAPDRMGDARGESLDDVRDPHAMGTAVPEEFLHLFRHEVTEDHADVRDARFSKVIEAVQDVRLVRERDQLLRARVRERSKPGPVAPRQDEPLHPDTPDLNPAGGTKLSRLRCSFIG